MIYAPRSTSVSVWAPARVGPQCKQCIDWASQGNRGQHGNHEECCPDRPEASRMVWGRGREAGPELDKQRTRENVLGRGQQGSGLDLSPSMGCQRSCSRVWRMRVGKGPRWC